MRKIKSILMLFIAVFFAIAANAQQLVTVSGKVTNNKSKEVVAAVSVTIKGTTIGTFTDDKGEFKITTTQKLPFVLVISSVGYADKEIGVTANNQVINASIDAKFTIGDEVIVSASRVSEKALETPVTVERISSAAIKNAPAANYYDILTNQKGVDVNVASLTFRTVTTRGFVSSGNLRFNQIMDGMDNQAPGLNFAVGSFIGLTELDVENMELLSGASSALYGPGGMNGTLLVNSKSPFKYQGLSFQVKQGVNHIDAAQRTASPYFNWNLRWAKKVSEKFAFKIGAEFIQANDWLATNTSNYSRVPTSASQNGNVIDGNRFTDPNYDGVNVYGDETTQNMSSIASSVIAATGLPASSIAAFNGFLAANPTASLATFNSFLTSAGAGALVAAGYSPIVYGAAPSRNYFNNQNVSRTGYDEKNVINPQTLNIKLQGALHYKITDNIEAIASAYYGTGNTVYTGSDRYSLKELKMGQYKLELKHRNWFLRAYTTREDAGQSYNATITTRLFNEAWKSSTAWYPQYLATYATYRSLGASNTSSHLSARDFADVGRPTGNIQSTDLFQSIASKPIGGTTNGGLFVDKSSLNMFEGQYNLSEDLKLKDKGFDVLVGANFKQYVLNSQGTLFADTAGKIKINETGAYLQVQKKLLGDVLKLTVSGRYDKNSNFAGRFTPRASAVVKLAKDHNVRVSYQSAYRFPSTQNQWINLFISGGARLMGGLPQLRDYYGFGSRPGYSVANVTQFGTAFATNVALQGGNPAAPTPTQAATALAATQSILQPTQFGEFKPETVNSYEIGYKGLIAKKLLIDVYAYQSKYNDFIGGAVVLQSNLTGATSPLGLLSSSTRQAYSISVNQTQEIKVTGWGASLEYLLPKNFSVTANVYSDEIGDVPVGFATYFNSPKYRVNVGLTNTGLFMKNRLGGSIVYHWQESFMYEGTFGAGQIPAYSTVDAVISYKIPQYKSMVKIGATNLWNKYYNTGWGAPSIGGLYYISYGFNVL
jgi:outer membrane receptor protein involved in Fe transport